MSQFMNIVRMQVKEGKLDEWRAHAEEHLQMFREAKGLVEASYVQTGDSSVCVVGRWESEEALTNARPTMIASLDGIRDLLVPFDDQLGITDPVSGPVILQHQS